MSASMFALSLISAVATLAIVIGNVVKPTWLAVVCVFTGGFSLVQVWVAVLLPKVH